jgi:hypothetical protein
MIARADQGLFEPNLFDHRRLNRSVRTERWRGERKRSRRPEGGESDYGEKRTLFATGIRHAMIGRLMGDCG